MKKIVTLLCAFCMAFSLCAQTIESNALFTTSSPEKNYKNWVTQADFYDLNESKLADIFDAQANHITLTLPTQAGLLTLDLNTQEVFTSDCVIKSPTDKNVSYTRGLHYAGTVVGATGKTMVALSVFEDYIMAVISMNGENYVLGHLQQGVFPASRKYVLYKERDLLSKNPFECGSSVLPSILNDAQKINQENKSMMPLSDKIVRVYVEVDHTLYTNNNSSTTNTTNYVTGLWNIVTTIYNNEQINTAISELFIWTTPDTYPSSSSGSALNAFRAAKNNVFNGDLAHLFSGDSSGGGVAWLDVLCASDYRYAYSGGLGSYSSYPTYSWSVMVVSHEMGHNLGSPHTQSCSWGPNNNQALDNCYTTEGGCAAGPAPTNGGTVMSYCHLSSAGINMANGFGTEPGNLIRARVLAAACLSNPNLPCSSATDIVCGTPVTGNTSTGTSLVNTYSITTDNLSGNELIYKLNVPQASDLTVTLTSSNPNLRVILSTGCNETSGAAYGTTYSYVNAQGNFYLIVDGLNGASDAFTLSVACAVIPVNCNTPGVTTWEYANNVTIGNVNNTSGNNSGFANFANTQIANTVQGNTVNVSVTPGFAGTTYNEYWRIWVDYNNDTDYDDTGELVFSTPNATATTQTGSFVVPITTTVGVKPMKVVMKYGTLPTTCETGYYEGETELYSLNVAAACLPPSSSSSIAQSATSQIIYWPAMPGAIKYQIRYRPVGTTTYSTFTVTPAYRIATALLANTAYEYNVRSYCTTTYTAWSANFNFNTTLGSCTPPTASYVVPVSTTQSRIYWTAMSGATSYQVLYRVAGSTGAFLSGTSTGAFRSFTGLTANTTYEYKIRARCGTVWTAYNDLATFTTLPIVALMAAPEVSTLEASSQMIVNLYPNPVSDELLIEVDSDQAVSFQILNINGQKQMSDAISDVRTTLNVKSLLPGIYILLVNDMDGNIQAQRFVKQ